MATRRLGRSVDRIKVRRTSRLGELGKNADAVNRLKTGLGEKTATIFGLEAREKALKDQLRATEQEYTVKTTSMRETELALAEKAAALNKLTSDLGERSALSESQKVEIVALRTQVDALKTQL